MFALDRATMDRLEPLLRRVLVIDERSVVSKLLIENLKLMGSRDVTLETDGERALKVAAAVEPTLIFVEYLAGVDGVIFTSALRRTSLACRKAPIVMIAAEATATSIGRARDAGVHEFLRKPFSNADLLRRLEVLSARPRDWIEARSYVGPDRRRFNSGETPGLRRRQSDRTAFPNEPADA